MREGKSAEFSFLKVGGVTRHRVSLGRNPAALPSGNAAETLPQNSKDMNSTLFARAQESHEENLQEGICRFIVWVSHSCSHSR